MRTVIQRCTNANIIIDDKEEKNIDQGFVIYLGLTHNDTLEDINYIIKKIVNLRVFEDENEKMNLSIRDINGSVMIVSQFTLYANTKKGNRPSFERSMKFEEAKELYDRFIEEFKKENINYVTGNFGSYMKVSYTNDGPVTIIIDSKEDL